jgi:EAL domain-containing protein (putative c-di-GMP-specific phosphodiesterase class I)
VETLDESENLKIQNVDYLQGYYFSKPMKKEDATLYIENDIKKD